MNEFLLAAYLGLLAAGVVGDITRRRVPNWLVLVLLMIALVGAFLGVSAARSPLAAVNGALVGLGMWFPFWMAGLLGAGDVKFFAAAAAWVGPSLTWRAALLAALLGGVMSVAVLAYRGGFKNTLESIAVSTENARAIIANADVAGADAADRTFPYALPMAMALAFAALQPVRLLSLWGN